jgi:TonB family protein
MVRVEAVVEADGKARIRAIDPPAGGECSDLVVAALKEIQFQTGMLNDKPVPVAVCIRVPFQYLHPPVPRLVSCQGPIGFGNQPSTANDPFRLPLGARPPVPIHSPEAQFSDEARVERIEGVVLISMIVDEHGMPTEIRVLRPAGHGLDENAVAAVSQYRFRPATLDGKPIAARVTIEISFRFRN